MTFEYPSLQRILLITQDSFFHSFFSLVRSIDRMYLDKIKKMNDNDLKSGYLLTDDDA